MSGLSGLGSSYYGMFGQPSAQLLGQYGNLYNQAQSVNQQRYNNVQGGFGALQGSVGTGYADLYSTLNGDFNSMLHDQGSGYDALYSRGMKDVQDYGTTELKDINDAYDQSMAQQRRSLGDRGLGNTTILNSIQSGSDQSRNRALTNAREKISQYKLGTDVNLSEAGLSNQNQLRQQQAATLAGVGQNRIGMQANLGSQQLAAMGQQVPYPDYGVMAGLAGNIGNLGLQASRYGPGGGSAGGGGGAGGGRGGGGGGFASRGDFAFGAGGGYSPSYGGQMFGDFSSGLGGSNYSNAYSAPTGSGSPRDWNGGMGNEVGPYPVQGSTSGQAAVGADAETLPEGTGPQTARTRVPRYFDQATGNWAGDAGYWG